jgi:hypothetical protein
MRIDYDVEWDDVIKTAIAAGRAEIFTEMPGKVTSYDPSTQTCSVQPMIKSPVFDPITREQSDSETLPELKNIPVGFFRGGGFSIVFPLNVGDEVTIQWQMLATGQWRTSGELSEPLDVRRHSVGSAIAVPNACSLLKTLLSPTVFSGMLAFGLDGDPMSTIRISNGQVVCGGAIPAPLAMGIQTAYCIAAIQQEVVTMGLAHAAMATAFAGLAAIPTIAAVPTTATACTSAGTACGNVAAVITAQAAIVTAQGPLIPSTITQGE